MKSAKHSLGYPKAQEKEGPCLTGPAAGVPVTGYTINLVGGGGDVSVTVGGTSMAVGGNFDELLTIILGAFASTGALTADLDPLTGQVSALHATK